MFTINTTILDTCERWHVNLLYTQIPTDARREINRLYSDAETAVERAEAAEKRAARLLDYAARQRAAADNLAAQIEQRYASLVTRYR